MAELLTPSAGWYSAADKMKAVRSLGNRKIEVVEKPVPKPGPGDVLLRVKAAPICGSDLHAIYRRAEPHPFIPGHEIAGEVVEAPKGSRWKAGDRVCVPAAIGCQTCEMCLKGFTIYCEKARVIGFGEDGAHAEYLVVPAFHPLPLPDFVSFEAGSLVADPVGVPFHEFRKMGLSSRDTIAIFGLGPMGLGAVVMARFLGAEVIGIEVNEYRLELARKLGANHGINPKKEDVKRKVMEITKGRGVEMAADCAGTDATLGLALDLTRKLGKVAIIGENAKATISPSDHFNRKELTLVGGTCFNLGEYDEILDVMRRGLKPERLVTHRFALEDAEEAYGLFDGGDAGKVVFTP
jgi:propanol-preferring alcohol dehydrogenase